MRLLPRTSWAAILTLVLVVSACSANASLTASGRKTHAPQAGTVAAKRISSDRKLLFAARGAGTLAGTTLALTLDPATITWITDRPARAAGRMEAATLVAAWKGFGLAHDPPNAVLLSAASSVGVELADPAWDPGTGTLRFTVTPLDHAALPTGDIGATELFIDDIAGSECLAGNGKPVIVTLTNAPAGTGTSCENWVESLETMFGYDMRTAFGTFFCEGYVTSVFTCTNLSDNSFTVSYTFNAA